MKWYYEIFGAVILLMMVLLLVGFKYKIDLYDYDEVCVRYKMNVTEVYYLGWLDNTTRHPRTVSTETDQCIEYKLVRYVCKDNDDECQFYRSERNSTQEEEDHKFDRLFIDMPYYTIW